MSTLLKAWMDKATTEQIAALAENADTSVGYLYQLASGRRAASSDIAARIEYAAELLVAGGAGTPGLLPRDFIAKVCASCPFAAMCRKTQEGNPK